MFPELFKIPGLGITVSTYGVLLAVGFITALWLIATLAERDGLPKNKIYDLGLYILASALIGAKLLMVITDWSEYGSWREAFSLDVLRSGGVYYGGFLIAVAVSVLLMKIWRLPWGKTADAFAPGIALGHAIGRLGCFSAGCCWGKPTTSWIGVKFTEKAHQLTDVPINSALVPTQLIEAICNLAILLVLLWLRKRRVFDGQIIYAYGMMYAVVRFTVEFWRDDPRGTVLGLSTSQFISLLMFPIALGLTVYYWRRSQTAKVSTQPEVAPQAL
ncbi:MAG TPA: prolipoprotein diacylglyceryl transferase [Blastocatellia bacterium]|nr:prolipoprotein diacylglyceryl transferase [Blastocatellia bacterium]